ncbi:MAG: Rrf2 family transcriptional regulator [Rhodospirillales bacterium]|jgi:Rrf2 family protein|nr:transcriptional regulator [Rhodospirillaceae bacterium]MDP6427495.1 Rrf2 family transcriptional regulator [Rhodospirillales bacterium]MDP6646255.1 Rrf2 family transcriptional regulator [Rhodospirillales bacterium]MDP6843324.1 Rrf2 family transcriptional regulator [Rhodospirillales bacterium]|tara:strand:- start:1105 stop:1560 length:456 start_codon:yes stop_codon:yes gene_type:complete
MFKLSRKVLFAIEAVVDIAYHSGGQPVQSKEITRRQGIPRRYLEQVLQRLVRADILVGVRGPRGGYNLARERRRVSVGEIIRVVRALETASDPLESADGSELAESVIRPLWGELQNELMERLDDLSVDELCNRAHQEGVESEGRQYIDFSI